MTDELRPVELGAHERLWFDNNKRPWLIKATFSRIGERIEVVGMEVRSVRRPDEKRLDKHLPETASGNGIAVSSQVWRSAGALISEMRQHYLEALRQSGMLTQPGNEESAVRWLIPKDESARLRDVAAIYKAAVEAGQSTTLAVSNHFGLSPSAAAKRVQRAREAGLLPPAKRGRRARNAP